MTSPPNPVTTHTPVCVVTGVSKRYGGVVALDKVDVTVMPGVVHAIVGENGAGKSTLMKVLVGAERPDSGDVVLDGARVSFANVREANSAGVAIVFQELSLFPDLDILTNLFPHAKGGRWGHIDREALAEEARPVLDELGVEFDLGDLVEQLSLGEQQLVEIAKAVLSDSHLLVLDEPNSALSASETEKLFAVVRRLVARGVSVLFISHRLEEVFEIADYITVMRNGKDVKHQPIADTSIRNVVELMIGRAPESDDIAPPALVPGPADGNALSLKNVAVKGSIDGVDLEVQPGEIVGLVGLEGSGATTVLDALFGAVPISEGVATLPNGDALGGSIEAQVKAGVSYIPADRRHAGLNLDGSIVDNVSLVTAGTLGTYGFRLKRRRIRDNAIKRAKELRLKYSQLDDPVSSLSGGNQQKVVIAKWLEADPNVVLLNDPTRGVDVGAKQEIYRVIHDLAATGHVVLFVSTELTEYSKLCHRVVVFYRGRVTGEVEGGAATASLLLHAINTGAIDQPA